MPHLLRIGAQERAALGDRVTFRGFGRGGGTGRERRFQAVGGLPKKEGKVSLGLVGRRVC
jgi:hypothetical protein